MPNLSIIIPIYNASSYLHTCVDSILSQSFSDFELILVDDGSSDNSGSICDEYVQKDVRVRVFHKDNGGVSSARNLGLEEAKGEYIYFPDSDDFVIGNALRILVDGINKECFFAVGGYEVYDEDDACIYSVKDTEEGIMSRDEMLVQFFAPSPYRYQGYLWNKLFKKSIVEQHNIRFEPSIKFNEDRLFCIRYVCALAKTDKVYYNWKPIYKYVQRSTSAMASLEKRFNPDFLTDLDAFVKMGHILRETKVNSHLLKAHYQSMLCSVGRMYAMCRQFKELNASWCYKIESRLLAGVGALLYVYRWISKVYRKIWKLFNQQKSCPNS